MSKDTDVVIIGCGFAGIAAARDLLAAGFSVVIIEARDRYHFVLFYLLHLD